MREQGPNALPKETRPAFEKGAARMIDYGKEAARYRPKEIRTLLVAESPPPGGTDYFYVPRDRVRGESLPGTIFLHYFGSLPLTKEDYERFLTDLQERGVFLIDIVDEPLRIKNKAFPNWVDPKQLNRLKSHIPGLRAKIRGLGIRINDQSIRFLLARNDYKKELKALFPDAAFYPWRKFRSCREGVI